MRRRRERRRRRRARDNRLPWQRPGRDHGRRVDDGQRRRNATRHHRRLLVDRPRAVVAPAQARRHGARGRRPLVCSRREGTWAASTGRAWPLPTSPARRRFSISGIPPGQWRRSSRPCLTGDAYIPPPAPAEGSPLREGGGTDRPGPRRRPLLFTAPSTSLGLGLLRRGSRARRFSPSDAGGGAGPWAVSIHAQSSRAVQAEPGSKTRGGSHARLCGSRSRGRPQRQRHRFRRLTRGADVRRIAYWLHVEVRGWQPTTTCQGRATTRRQRGRRRGHFLPLSRGPPECRPARRAGAGVPDLRRGSRTSASCRHRGRESRSRRGSSRQRREPLVGYIGIPATSTRIGPRPGGAGRGGGASPIPEPTSSSSTRPAEAVAPSHSDSGSTTRHPVDQAPRPQGQDRTADRSPSRRRLRGRPARLPCGGRREAGRWRTPTACTAAPRASRAGKQTVTVRAADYQETKNMEDVCPVLPNTRVLHTTVTLHR